MEEPSANKRPRSAIEEPRNEQRYRSVSLDMERYGEWVRNLSDKELVSVFDLGVKVRESVVLTVDVSQKFMEKALSSQMRPVQESVANIGEVVKQQVQAVQENVGKNVSDQVKKMSEDVTKNIKSVTEKVPPLDSVKTEIKDSEKRITDALEKHKVQLDAISATLANPSKKGARAEKNVLEILNENLCSSSFTFRDTSAERGKGDIEAESPDGHKIMIEVKKWSASLSKEAVESFENNLAKSPDLKVGILLSMSSGIARRSKGRRFEIAFSQDQKQYQIYVPNAYVNNEEHLIVWSVVMAAELAKIESGDLGEKKTQELKKIYTQFQANIQYSQNCRASLTALESSVENLKDNIVPILDTVDNTKNDIYKLLHSS